MGSVIVSKSLLYLKWLLYISVHIVLSHSSIPQLFDGALTVTQKLNTVSIEVLMVLVAGLV